MVRGENAATWIGKPTTEVEKDTLFYWCNSIESGDSSNLEFINAAWEKVIYVGLYTQPSLGWLDEEIAKLKGIASLEDDWDTYGAPAPNEAAIDGALNALQQLNTLTVRPDRIAPTAEGGVAISFFEDQKYADIEFFNSGEIAAIMSDANGPEVWEVSDLEVELSLRKIVRYVGRRIDIANATRTFSSASYILCDRRAVLPNPEGSSSTKWQPRTRLDSLSEYICK